MVSTCPVRSRATSGTFHSTPLCRNYEERFSVRAPSIQAKQLRSMVTVCRPRRLRERAHSGCWEHRRTGNRRRHRCRCCQEPRCQGQPTHAGASGFRLWRSQRPDLDPTESAFSGSSGAGERKCAATGRLLFSGISNLWFIFRTSWAPGSIRDSGRSEICALALGSVRISD